MSDFMSDKHGIREEIWGNLERSGVASDCHGSIPDFVGKEAAARHLAHLTIWRNAEVVMIAPDASLSPVRELALQEGKLVYLAVPGLKKEKPFVSFDSLLLPDAQEKRADIGYWLAVGRPVSLQEIQPVDLAIGGSVAVNKRGVRLGKGKGYFDLELAMLVETGAMQPDTPVATIVHSMQIVEGDLPETRHDGRVIGYATEVDAYVIDETDRRHLPGLVRDHLEDYAGKVPALEGILRSE